MLILELGSAYVEVIGNCRGQRCRKNYRQTKLREFSINIFSVFADNKIDNIFFDLNTNSIIADSNTIINIIAT
jgi:hypothetical protein